MDPDTGRVELQNKVQYDICYYFCRRGNENFEKMKISDFELVYNKDTDSEYLVKCKDELTKSHRDVEHPSSGFMPENKGDRLCPIQS